MRSVIRQTGLQHTLVRGSLVGVLTLVLLGVAVPAVAGVGWGVAVAGVAALRWWWVPLLATLWLVGLGMHTVTLTAALPGLTHRRALLLSLSGSAVANTLPAGGAAGIWLNRTMTRGWGHDRAAFASYTVVTNLWDVLAKVALALVAVPLLVLTGTLALSGLGLPALVAAGIAGLLAAGVAALIASPPAVRVVARWLDAAGRLWPGRVARTPRKWGEALLAVHRSTATLVAQSWGRLTLGMVCYLAALGVLLAACAAAAGLPLTVLGVLGALSVERLLTLAGITPGGAGFVEIGMTATLLALGGAPAAVLTTVVLYRIFTYLLEIPVGGLGLAGWALMRRRALAPPLRAVA